MSQIYVASKSTDKIFKRIAAFNGTTKRERFNGARIVVSLVREVGGNKDIRWPKHDLVKITKEENPEYFL